jgi:hypothetical protein
MNKLVSINIKCSKIELTILKSILNSIEEIDYTLAYDINKSGIIDGTLSLLYVEKEV